MSGSAGLGDFVTPGDSIGLTGQPGSGVATSNDSLIATMTGKVSQSGDEVCVEAVTDSPRTLSVGDVFIGEVERLQNKTAMIHILHVEGSRARDIPAEQLYCDVFVSEIVDRFLPAPCDAMLKRDVVRCEVIADSPALKGSMKRSPKHGVLFSLCPACGLPLQTNDEKPDFNVKCSRCDYSGYRALADDYGIGFLEEGNASSLNRNGERWSSEAESGLSHEGSRSYRSFLADHRRGMEHEVPASQRQRSSGRGGGRPRREMTKTTCTLCGDSCEVPFKPTPGKPIRCRPCMGKIEAGEADKEALAKEREILLAAREKANEASGLKVFVGGLPYETDQDGLKEVFAKHGDIKSIDIATDKDGKSKGFAFVTFASYAAGKKALGEMKGIRIGGRKISIQEAKSNDRGGRGGGHGRNRRGGGRRR